MRKLAFVTTTRADYGLISGLIKRVHDEKQWEVNLVVLGTHLSQAHGYTISEIEKNGVPITYRADTAPKSGSESDVALAAFQTGEAMSEYFSQHKPDLLCVVGDRYEMLAIALSATLHKVPIIHLYGGDITRGAYDDQIRHALTKLSHLHFCSCEASAKRIAQMGEAPDRVYMVGSPALDVIPSLEIANKETLENTHHIKFGEQTLLVALNPTTNANYDPIDELSALLGALEKLPEKIHAVFTAANADTHGQLFNERFKVFSAQNPGRFFFVPSFGQQHFMSMLSHVSMIVGNSSSGLLEAPSFGIPTINIGERQSGREKAVSVQDVLPNEPAILSAITHALDAKYIDVVNPYGDGKSVARIVTVLNELGDLKPLLKKPFIGPKN